MRISVITVSLNRAHEIEKTIQSVLNQSYPNIEYWIIDGGSTDGTLPILERYKDRLNYISEKDKGIYHAMNKGIRRVNGDYLLFLNAGDHFFLSTSLQTLLINGVANADLIFGNLMMVEKNYSWEKRYPVKLSFDFFLKDFLPHPATLIKKSLFDLVGSYNENNRIVSDWEFFLHVICKYNASYKYVDKPISVFHTDGISSVENSLSIDEKNRILELHYPNFMDDYKALDEYRSELQHIRNSRLHSLVSAVLSNQFYKLIKGKTTRLQR